jgi:hypothetical protein
MKICCMCKTKIEDVWNMCFSEEYVYLVGFVFLCPLMLIWSAEMQCYQHLDNISMLAILSSKSGSAIFSDIFILTTLFFILTTFSDIFRYFPRCCRYFHFQTLGDILPMPMFATLILNTGVRSTGTGLSAHKLRAAIMQKRSLESSGC